MMAPSLQEILDVFEKSHDNHMLLSVVLTCLAEKAEEAAKRGPKPEPGKMPIVTIAIDPEALRESAEELQALRRLCQMLIEKIDLQQPNTSSH